MSLRELAKSLDLAHPNPQRGGVNALIVKDIRLVLAAGTANADSGSREQRQFRHPALLGEKAVRSPLTEEDLK
jgi:hypothetical protein